MVGILISFWDGLFSGAMLVSGRVVIFVSASRMSVSNSSMNLSEARFRDWSEATLCMKIYFFLVGLIMGCFNHVRKD